MCGAIVTLIVALVVIAAVFGSIIICAGIVLLIFFLVALGSYIKSLDMKPSEMRCPNCGGTQIQIKSRIDGITGAKGAYGGLSTFTHNLKRSHIGVCGTCGFDYPYFIVSDVESIKASAQSKMIISGVLLLIYIALAVLHSRR